MPIKAKQLDTSGIVERDAAPTLGANLDIGANNSIVATGSKDISITPDAGSVILDGMSWPQADGTPDQVLKTNGAGQLSWTDVTSGLNTTDDLNEGNTNLYYTNTKVDTRIAAASIGDLSDVNTTSVTNGYVLEYSSGQWSAAPASSGASRPTVTLESGNNLTISAPSSSDLEHIYYFTSGSAVSVTLPSASGITGYKLNLKRTGTGTVSITADGTETIDNSASISLATQYDSYTLVSNGSGWLIL
jgi:hypothetical protein